MIRKDFFLFNTTNTISAETEDEAVLSEALGLCRHYEALFSRVAPSSELHRLNGSAGHSCAVDPELASLMKAALSYCEQTNGLYDITMGSVTQLWDFAQGAIPSADAVGEALAHVDYRNVIVDGASVTLRDPMACVDLGGIAKGYIADGLLAFLREHGVEHAVVNLGGNVAAFGGRPDGAPWRIGIRKPLPSSAIPLLDSFATVKIMEGSVVTSGVYERSFTRNGAIYHHILDPRTGMPADTDVLSATVLSRASIDADGFTTALVIMGTDRALAFAESHPGIEAVIVTQEGDVLATSGVGSKIPFELTA